MNEEARAVRFIDGDAARESIARRPAGEDVFIATALYELECGHVRPLNRQLETYETNLGCLACETGRRVLSQTLIEPTEFPAPSLSLSD